MLRVYPLLAAFFCGSLALAGTHPKGERLLWDSWYTMTVNKTTHYGYYNEHVTVKEGHVHFQYSLWKDEEGFINEEQLGTVAEFKPELTPLFFNFHSKYRISETTIDGSAKDRIMNIKVRKGTSELPVIRKSIPPKVILSQFFPVWLGFRLTELKPGKALSFMAIPEDDVEHGFSPLEGRVRMEKADEFAESSRSTKLTVEYHDMTSNWWVDKNGSVIRIRIPSQQTVVDRVTKAEAEKFLSSGNTTE